MSEKKEKYYRLTLFHHLRMVLSNGLQSLSSAHTGWLKIISNYIFKLIELLHNITAIHHVWGKRTDNTSGITLTNSYSCAAGPLNH